jgi:hypothetical protein
MVPQQPAAGESATATITVRNVGLLATPALDLIDVLQGAEVRSAGGGAAQCGVVARQADCRLQSLAPGASTALEVRLLVDRSPAPSKVAQQIRLAATGDVIVADRAVAVPVAGEDGGLARLLEGPGTAVTLGATFGLVLAARPRSPSGRRS